MDLSVRFSVCSKHQVRTVPVDEDDMALLNRLTWLTRMLSMNS